MKHLNEDTLAIIGALLIIAGTAIEFGAGYACIVGGVLSIAIAAAVALNAARAANKDPENATSQPARAARQV